MNITFGIQKTSINLSYSSEDRTQSEDIPPMSDPVSATRILCGALLLPSIASICGRIFFESIHSNFQRTLLVRSAYIFNVLTLTRVLKF